MCRAFRGTKVPTSPPVAIIMGSQSDWPNLRHAAETLDALKIDYEERPPFFEVSPTHKARTWLLDPRAPKVERPEIIRKLSERRLTEHG